MSDHPNLNTLDPKGASNPEILVDNKHLSPIKPYELEFKQNKSSTRNKASIYIMPMFFNKKQSLSTIRFNNQALVRRQ